MSTILIVILLSAFIRLYFDNGKFVLVCYRQFFSRKGSPTRTKIILWIAVVKRLRKTGLRLSSYTSTISDIPTRAIFSSFRTLFFFYFRLFSYLPLDSTHHNILNNMILWRINFHQSFRSQEKKIRIFVHTFIEIGVKIR